MPKQIVLLFLFTASFTAIAVNSIGLAFADDKKAIDNMFGQFSGQAFRDSFFSQHDRMAPGDLDAEIEAAAQLREEEIKKRKERDLIEEKDKLERAEKRKQIFDRDESTSEKSGGNKYTTPILDNDFTFDFEKHVLQPDLFSADKIKSPFDFAQIDEKDPDWMVLMRSNSGLFPRAREVDDHTYDRDYDSPERRKERAMLPGPVIEVTGDWVPDKLDPTDNGGFTIAPDNGSPVPYKLNGHVDIQRGRPWNDNN